MSDETSELPLEGFKPMTAGFLGQIDIWKFIATDYLPHFVLGNHNVLCNKLEYGVCKLFVIVLSNPFQKSRHTPN